MDHACNSSIQDAEAEFRASLGYLLRLLGYVGSGSLGL